MTFFRKERNNKAERNSSDFVSRFGRKKDSASIENKESERTVKRGGNQPRHHHQSHKRERVHRQRKDAIRRRENGEDNANNFASREEGRPQGEEPAIHRRLKREREGKAHSQLDKHTPDQNEERRRQNTRAIRI